MAPGFSGLIALRDAREDMVIGTGFGWLFITERTWNTAIVVTHV